MFQYARAMSRSAQRGGEEGEGERGSVRERGESVRERGERTECEEERNRKRVLL